MNVKLIPLIELPTLMYSDLEEISEIHKRTRLLIERNYSAVKNLTPFNEHQYILWELNDIDLKKAIDLHISDLKIEESCAFFGGYALKLNEKYVLFPQCCGLLSEINDWKKILNPNFEPFYLSESHPSPRFRKEDNKVIIECDSSQECFIPKTEEFIVVDYHSLVTAINTLCNELKRFSKRLDKLNSEYQTKSVSNKMIWEL